MLLDTGIGGSSTSGPVADPSGAICPFDTTPRTGPIATSPPGMATLFQGGANGCWYDPSDLATLFQSGTRASPGPAVTADGDPVGLMLDKSGNNNDVTFTSKPTFKNTGGPPRLSPDGVANCGATSTFDLSAYGQLGAAIAVKPGSTATGIVCELGPDANANSQTFFLLAANDGSIGQLSSEIAVGSGIVDAVETTATTNGSGVTSVMSYQSFDITQAAATAKLPMRRNGATVATTVASDAAGAGTVFSGTQVLHLFARNGASLFYAGDFYGLVIRGGAFSTGELATVEQYEMGAAGLLGTAYNDNLSEAATAADSASPAGSIFGVADAEAAAAADVAAAAQTFVNADSEAATAADSVAGGLLLGGSLNETSAAVDSSTTSVTWRPAQTESAAAADSAGSQAVDAASDAESAAATDQAASTLVAGASLGEAATSQDSASAGATTFNDTLAESLAPAASLGVGLVLGASLVENTAAADSAAGATIEQAADAESAAAADTATATIAAAAALAEAAGANDNVTADLVAAAGALGRPDQIGVVPVLLRIGGSGAAVRTGASSAARRVG